MARRKTQKNTEYFEQSISFGPEDKQMAGKWGTTHFKNSNPLVLELGCGTADLSYGLAQMYPDRNYLGIDRRPARLWKPALNSTANTLSNISFLCINLIHIDQYFAEGEVAEIWITFPDPFPKNKHVKHRMINHSFLTQYKKILQPGGVIQFKTDSLALFQYALEVFVREGNIRFHQLSFDLHKDEHCPADTKITTEYERKFMAEEIKINYVKFSFID